jgi:hypothetical protein
MTILEAIERVDSLRHNTFTQEEKIGWLAQVDALVAQELIRTHEGADGEPFQGYDSRTPLDRELLVPNPYDELYLHYLEAQMDYYHGEYDRYNRSMGMYQAVWLAFANFYNRSNRPLGQRFRYF